MKLSRLEQWLQDSKYIPISTQLRMQFVSNEKPWLNRPDKHNITCEEDIMAQIRPEHKSRQWPDPHSYNGPLNKKRLLNHVEEEPTIAPPPNNPLLQNRQRLNEHKRNCRHPPTGVSQRKIKQKQNLIQTHTNNCLFSNVGFREKHLDHFAYVSGDNICTNEQLPPHRKPPPYPASLDKVG